MKNLTLFILIFLWAGQACAASPYAPMGRDSREADVVPKSPVKQYHMMMQMRAEEEAEDKYAEIIAPPPGEDDNGTGNETANGTKEEADKADK